MLTRRHHSVLFIPIILLAAAQREFGQPQTGPDAVPVIYGAKYLPDDVSCPATLVRFLWGIPDAQKKQWKPFDPIGGLPQSSLPQMNPFLGLNCGQQKQ